MPTAKQSLAAFEKAIKRAQTIAGAEADGDFGTKSKAAEKRLRAAEKSSPGATWPPVTSEGGTVDERSEKAIATLLPQIQPTARNLVRVAARKGIKIIITSALRTYAEQAELYAQGRTKPGKKVTNAKAGYSWHNFGVAFDVTVFKGTEPKWEGPEYKTVGELGEALGLEWGGRFVAFKDEPHFQLTNGKSLAEARALHDQGKTVFA